PAKLLAYADDVFLFLHDSNDLNCCIQHLQTYAVASNAKPNFLKSHAISPSGRPSDFWRTTLLDNNIPSWHDATTNHSLVYLAYPLYSTPSQRDHFSTQLL
ncbi:uncharacterized protein BYT42DRAFT_475275, partial [Radiomyces spectabilis]|uniref:uncharacterized protein n=1 Tax=Radiomyces spectabilis TaxID=64574 RepID=UPI00221FB902